MNWPLSQKVVLLAAAMVTLLASGCTSSRCGLGTTEVDGVCVSTQEPITCADGTIFNEATGACEPTITCGVGTHYSPKTGTCEPLRRCGEGTTLDPDSGRCVAEVTCGEGTAFNPSTRACEPTQKCGEGTELVNGECWPVDRCGPGTVYVTDALDPKAGMCMPTLSCGEGLVIYENQCVTAAEIAKLGTDVEESIAGNNNPALGGTPEALTLKPMGSQVVFTGTIGRAVDVDLDGEVDQDLDAWAFEGTAGMLLEISIISDGLPQPAFQLTGPEGFRRDSRIGGSIAATRRVLLPFDGTYVLTVGPAIYWATGTLLGGTSHRYVGVVQELPWPSPTAVEVAAPPSSSSIQGKVLNFNENFYAFSTPTDAALRITGNADAGSTEPVLMLFGDDRSYIGEVNFTAAASGAYMAAATGVLAADQQTIAVLDWRRSDGTDANYELAAHRTEIDQLSPVEPGAPLTVSSRTVQPQELYAFSLDAIAGQVVSINLSGMGNGSLSASGPSGLIATNLSGTPAEFSFYARTTGRYTWVYVNEGTAETTLWGEMITSTPIDAGVLDPTQGASSVVAGENLHPGRRFFDRGWVKVETAAAGLLQARWGYRLGRPEVELYRVRRGGGLVSLGKVDARAPDVRHALLDEAGILLARLQPTTPSPTPVLDWWMEVTSFLPPSLREVEPNDQALLATPVEAGQQIMGTVSAGDTDIFFITLPGPLLGNEALSIVVESLVDGEPGPGFTLYDSTYTAITSFNKESGRPAAEWLLFPYEGSILTEFYLEIQGKAGDAERGYLVSLQSVIRNSELEPNNDVTSAENLGTLVEGTPLQVYGSATRSSAGADYYSFTVPAAMPMGTSLWVRARPLSTPVASGDVVVTLIDPISEKVVTSGEADFVNLLATLPRSGAWVVEVRGDLTTRKDQYVLEIDTLTPTEVEPNDDRFLATLLGDLPLEGQLEVWGSDSYASDDIYRVGVALAEALGPNEMFSTRFQTYGHGSAVEVNVVTDTGDLLATNRGSRGEVVVSPGTWSGPFFVRVVPRTPVSSASPELYHLTISRVSGVADVEPNDAPADAQEVASLPALIRGQSRGGSSADPDFYSISLPPGLQGDEKLYIQLQHPLLLDALSLTVLDVALEPVATATGSDINLAVLLPDHSAGAVYYLGITSGVSRTGEWPVYEARVELRDTP